MSAPNEHSKLTSVKSFKTDHDLDHRKKLSAAFRQKYPDKIPIIVEKAKGSTLPDLEKNKFLCPSDSNMGKLIFEVRQRIPLRQEQAIFLFLDNTTIAPINTTIGEIYQRYGAEDGFLYVTVTAENTFG